MAEWRLGRKRKNKLVLHQPNAQPTAAGNGVEAAVTSWAQAWSRQDVDAYLAAYAADFTAPGLRRARFVHSRRHAMNTEFRTSLPGTALDYFDAREAVNAIRPGAWDKLPYTARVHAENIVRRAEPAIVTECLTQLVERKRERDFPWFPARVVCHDILGQTALVDLAGLRDAIADQGGDPAQVNPVVPVQLIVDHSLAVECGGYDPDAFAKNRAIEDRRNADRFNFKVPTLRNVELTYPYFHDGETATLTQAVDIMGRLQLGRTYSAAENAQIVAFLKTLTGDQPQFNLPILPPSSDQTRRPEPF